MRIEDRIDAFRKELSTKTVDNLVRRHITFGECYALKTDAYFELKERISHHFGIHHNEVVVVGSAKLGFSIAPDKRYRPFGNTSDIDVALCCGQLFDKIWADVFDYWRAGGFWHALDQFRKYLFRGWMRPDKLPKSYGHTQEWWDFFRSLSATSDFGPYKVSGALYKDWHFLESYQAKCVTDCQLSETDT